MSSLRDQQALIESYQAVLFDLDGVITDTARLHSKAWKQTFDEYLGERGSFEIETDYKLYVDGKPRYKGVESFLSSRSIELPWGSPEDAPDAESICGIGNKKNYLVNELIKSEGVETIPGSLEFVEAVRSMEIKTAVVSSSKNCQAVLQAAGIEDRFEVRVDGLVAEAENIAGKPAPDTFLAAAKKLGTPPLESVVIEDAISGVQAGRAGAFGLVVGIGNEELLEQGADVVVQDLRELLA